MSERGNRELRFSQKMTDVEALMWNIEKDPWLNPNGGLISVLDRPVDVDQFRHRIRHAISKISRLRERVKPGFGRMSPPEWVTDPEFDLDHHLRHISLPAPGTVRQLYDLAARLMDDPFDRTRPLWVFYVIDGIEDGQGALFWKMHHSITDGEGAVRLSELYMELEREAPLPPPVDLDVIIAESLTSEERDATGEAGDASSSVAATALRTARHLLRRQAGIAQRAAGEVALWGADPLRIADAGNDVGALVTQARDQLGGRDEGGSPLWQKRSRRRLLKSLRIPLDDVKAAGKALGGTVNDVFVTGAVEGAVRYHDARATPLEALNISFVVSTRDDKAIGGNSFTPTLLQAPAGEMTIGERFSELQERMVAKRNAVKGDGLLSTVAGIANLLPTSVVTRVARSQAAKQDFATSNLRAAPFPTYISGGLVLYNATLGPVAGTAYNLTTVSYNGSLDLGFHIDPAAVEDPDDLLEYTRQGYTDLLAAGGVVTDLEPAI